MAKAFKLYDIISKPQLGPVAQWVVSLTADPRETGSILARSHTFVEIDREMMSTVIILLPLIEEGLLSVTRESMCMKNWLNT